MRSRNSELSGFRCKCDLEKVVTFLVEVGIWEGTLAEEKAWVQEWPPKARVQEWVQY